LKFPPRSFAGSGSSLPHTLVLYVVVYNELRVTEKITPMKRTTTRSEQQLSSKRSNLQRRMNDHLGTDFVQNQR
jgi:hypothetical protein